MYLNTIVYFDVFHLRQCVWNLFTSAGVITSIFLTVHTEHKITLKNDSKKYRNFYPSTKIFSHTPQHWECGKILTSHSLQDESCISLLFSPLKLAPKANTKTKIKYFFKQYNGNLFTTFLHIKYKHIKHTQRHVLLNAMISYHFNNVCGGSSHHSTWSLASLFL